MAKHTPGPWEVGPVDDTVVTHKGKDGVRYEVAAIDGDYNAPDTWPIMEANARLIAAAPDLLTAAIEAESETPGDEFERRNEHGVFVWMTWETIEALRAAIAKATLPQGERQ